MHDPRGTFGPAVFASMIAGFELTSRIYYTSSTMYAIIETGGKQYWVVPGETLRVEKLAGKKGDKLTFKALWTADVSRIVVPKWVAGFLKWRLEIDDGNP